MNTFSQYIKDIRMSGRMAFTSSEAAGQLKASDNAVRCAMHRLKKQGDIVSPAKGFYVIVPPEYQGIGCLPPDLLIPLLMDYWQQDYYVALLSAADYYGAAHQKPQKFQVITNKQLKPIVIGKVAIEFVYKKSLAVCPKKSIAVFTGYLNIASPELIVMDMFLYPKHAGGLNNIATTLTELIEAISLEKLLSLADQVVEKGWLQKLGFILESLDSTDLPKQENLIAGIANYLDSYKIFYMKLAADLPIYGKTYNPKWKVIVNTTVESDE